MAHKIYIANGKASMAYAASGGVPWHKLGQAMPDSADMETWREACGFDFEILKAPVDYHIDGKAYRVPDRFVLYRSDSKESISVMSDRYQIVQPAQVLDFFSEVCERQGGKMDTAGVLKEGAQYWCMIKKNVGDDVRPGDRIELYILLATSADGSLATTAQMTGIRVVCANTLAVAMRASNSGKVVRVKHNTAFDAKAVQRELGMIDFESSWDHFVGDMRKLADVPISASDATKFFSNLLRPGKDRKQEVVIEQEQLGASDFSGLLSGKVKAGHYSPVVEKESDRAIRGLAELENSYYRAPGACPGSLYGVLQGVTHYLDHERGSDANRLSSAWFGQGAALKETAFSQLLERAAA